MKEEWLMPGAIVPVDIDTTKALVDEIKRLIGVIGGMALQPAAPVQEPWEPHDTAYRPGGLPQDFMKHEVENEGDWSEWVSPDPEQYFMKCCDCGLVHEMQFKVAKYSEGDECEFVADADLQAVFRARRVTQPAAPVQELTQMNGKQPPAPWNTPAAQRPVAEPHKWVELTDEEIQQVFVANSVMVDNGNAYMVAGLRAVNIARAIEAKLKEKNHG